MVSFGLAGEAGNHIRANRRVGKPFAHQFRAARVMFRTVPAAHRCKERSSHCIGM